MKGRDCIEQNAILSFNCQTACDGMYADTAKWEDKTLENVIKPLVSEYRAFKQNNVRHFKFNSAATSTHFGKKSLKVGKKQNIEACR